jgi:intracellular sulfur oxidation DsrE/DsrF family protein
VTQDPFVIVRETSFTRSTTVRDLQQISDARTPRRGFLARLAGTAAAMATALSTPGLLAAAPTRADAGARDASADPGDDWMGALTGKHRTVFDVAAHRSGKPLAQSKNWLDAWRDAFHLPEHELNLVIGIHGEGIPIVLTDAVWERYKIGEQYEVTDAGKAPAAHNVFTAANVQPGGPVTAEQTVEALQQRGVRFVVCMNTIAGATNKLAAAGLGGRDEIRAALLGGLLPGVITVPAMVVALTQLQERGVKYTKIA